MGSDSPLSARMHSSLRGGDTPADQVDRPQFFADVRMLELRLAIIDDRFDRLAARPDDAYRDWRRDTVTRLRSVADRAGVLEAHGLLETHQRRHVAAMLTVLRRRIAQLDARHATLPRSAWAGWPACGPAESGVRVEARSRRRRAINGEDDRVSDLFEHLVRVVDRTARSAVIVLAPHGGRAIPARYRGAFHRVDDELSVELEHMTDAATDELVASVAGVSTVVNALSRLVVDVERFDDPTEEMNAVGQGVLYTHDSHRRPLRSVPADDVAPLKRFHRAYGDAVTTLTDAALAAHGRAVLLDVHSYLREPLPYELHARQRRPELCIGFDEFHAGESLRAAVAESFAGFDRVDNEPFQGAYVPVTHYRVHARVQSIMLELRRDVMAERFAEVQMALHRLVAAVERPVGD